MKEKTEQKQKNRWGIKTAYIFEFLDLDGNAEYMEVVA